MKQAAVWLWVYFPSCSTSAASSKNLQEVITKQNKIFLKVFNPCRRGSETEDRCPNTFILHLMQFPPLIHHMCAGYLLTSPLTVSSRRVRPGLSNKLAPAPISAGRAAALRDRLRIARCAMCSVIPSSFSPHGDVCSCRTGPSRQRVHMYSVW